MALAVVLAGVACNPEPSVGTTNPAAATVAPLAVPPPADHLAPDELLEGTERAFGIALPRGLTVEERYPDTVYAGGPVTVHALVLYLRPRLQGGSLRESPTVATFEHVSTPGLPPGTDLTIHLTMMVGETRLQISSFTTPVAPMLPDEAARWQQAGLTPAGKVLDPTHLD